MSKLFNLRLIAGIGSESIKGERESYYKNAMNKLVNESKLNRDSLDEARQKNEILIKRLLDNILEPGLINLVEENYSQLQKLFLEQKNIVIKKIDLFEKALISINSFRQDNLMKVIKDVREVINVDNQQELNIRNLQMSCKTLRYEIGKIDEAMEDIKFNHDLTISLFKDRHKTALKERLINLVETRHKMLEIRNAKNIIAESEVAASRTQETGKGNKINVSHLISRQQKEKLLEAFFVHGFAQQLNNIHTNEYYLGLLRKMLNGENLKSNLDLNNVVERISYNIQKILIGLTRELQNNTGHDLEIIRAGEKTPEYYLAVRGEYKKIQFEDGRISDYLANKNPLAAEKYEMNYFYRLLDVMAGFFASKLNEMKLNMMKEEDEKKYPQKIDGKWEYSEEQLRNLYWKLRLITYG